MEAVEDKQYDEAKAKSSLCDLFEQYASNTYITNKLLHHMCDQLPVLMQRAAEHQVRREDRKRSLTEAADSFVERFLGKNVYVYSHTASMFFHYDRLHYHVYNEDDILYEILRGITHQPGLHPWKHKIKVHILKRIKERPLVSCIPDSATIQFVVNSLHPAVFKTRVMAKYFLCVVGDGLLKKNENLIYITSSDVKSFVLDIAASANSLFGQNAVASSFKYKYYDHSFSDCRLIATQFPINDKVWEGGLRKHMVDVLCVAAHYSDRYGSADDFMAQHRDTCDGRHALYLTTRTNCSFITDFIRSHLSPSTQASCTISSKSMTFLWKNYLARLGVPSVIFASQVKALLQERLSFDTEEDTYTHVTSSYLPSASAFTEFWRNEISITEDDDEELEIEELLTLLRAHNRKIFGSVTTNELLSMLGHFCPEVTVDDDKYIQCAAGKSWNKKGQISDFLATLRDQLPDQIEEHATAIPMFKAYERYAAHMRNKQPMVSKRYFERYVGEYLAEYINEDGCIEPGWYAPA